MYQAGLTYGKNIYDKERYERIRNISAEMLSNKTDISIEKVKDLFCNETGYQPPGSDHFPLFSFTRSILLSLKIAALVSSLGV